MNQILSIGNEIEKNIIYEKKRKIFFKKKNILVLMFFVVMIVVIYCKYYVSKSIDKQEEEESIATVKYTEEHKTEEDDDEVVVVILNLEKSYFTSEEPVNDETTSEESEQEEINSNTETTESDINTVSLKLISNVPFYNQNSLGYPMGCEAVSTAMVARYENYYVSVEEIIENTPRDERGIWKENIITETGEVQEVTYGGNPFEVFVGHPTKTGSQGSYGCFAKPIIVSLTALGISCTNISGCTEDELLNYIDEGKPVIVWGTYQAKNIVNGVTWTYPDNSGKFTKLEGEHCMVLVGYDNDNVYLNDPLLNANVTQPKYKFFNNWEILYKQAIIIN